MLSHQPFPQRPKHCLGTIISSIRKWFTMFQFSFEMSMIGITVCAEVKWSHIGTMVDEEYLF